MRGKVYLAVSELPLGKSRWRCPPSAVRLNISTLSSSSKLPIQHFYIEVYCHKILTQHSCIEYSYKKSGYDVLRLEPGSHFLSFRDKDLTASTGYVYSDWFTRGRHGPCRYRDFKSNFTAMTFLPSSLCTQSHPVVVVDQPGTRWVLGTLERSACFRAKTG